MRVTPLIGLQLLSMSHSNDSSVVFCYLRESHAAEHALRKVAFYNPYAADELSLVWGFLCNFGSSVDRFPDSYGDPDSSCLIWNVMRRCPHIVTGLRRAGFAGGWL